MGRSQRRWIWLALTLLVGALLGATTMALRSSPDPDPGAPTATVAAAIATARGADEPIPTATPTETIATPTSTPVPTATACIADCATATPPPPATPTAQPTVAPTPTLAPTPDLATASRWRWRATTSFAALQRTFSVDDDGFYRERFSKDRIFDVAFLWPMTQVLAAHTDLSHLPGSMVAPDDVAQVSEAVEGYYDDSRQPPAFSSYLAPPAGWVSDRYYDDNVWLGIELMRAWRVTGDELALQRADEIFDYLISGWDTDGPRPGGIYWIESGDERDRNTVTTGTAALLGLMLHDALPDDDRATEALEWAARMYAWVYATLERDDGLFGDHVRPDGSIDYAIYSYNQGAMIGANVWFHAMTGDSIFLDRAERIALATLAVDDGIWDIEAQEISFNAIFFSFLLELERERSDPAYRERLWSYAERVWELNRDPETGLATTSQPLTLLDQAAMVRLLALAATVR